MTPSTLLQPPGSSIRTANQFVERAAALQPRVIVRLFGRLRRLALPRCAGRCCAADAPWPPHSHWRPFSAAPQAVLVSPRTVIPAGYAAAAEMSADALCGPGSPEEPLSSPEEAPVLRILVRSDQRPEAARSVRRRCRLRLCRACCDAGRCSRLWLFPALASF